MNFWISNRNFIRKIRQSIMYKKVAKEAKLYSSSKREYVSDKFKKEKKKKESSMIWQLVSTSLLTNAVSGNGFSVSVCLLVMS